MEKLEHPFLVSLNSLELKMEQLLREFKKDQIQDPEYIILNNADFLHMFKISSKTAQTWRDEGLINYAQVKGKIYYKLKDIHVFLDQHYKHVNL
jgi:hypothetical protein